ncbi:hypothetical protein KAU51_04350 [Candidatus Parcubacteria bacterium]|nr:hypothetical protein [Candidatus Parcubacteria bacterium]
MTKDKLRFKLEFKDKDSKEVHIIPTGKWDHPAYGEMEITPKDIKEFKKNFDAKIRKGVPITAGHDGFTESNAMGWITEVIDKGKKGLFAIIEWTKQGKTLLEEKSFKYFSPEYYRVYEDPETRKEYENVLTGGALTNSPYFKKLKAVVFSDKDLINFNEKTMSIEEILKKDVSELTDEEKETLKTADLTDDQKDKYKDILEDDGDDGDDNNDGDDNDGDDDDKDGDDKDGDDGDGDGDDGDDDDDDGKGVKGSEVKISASEYKILTKKANQGAEALKQLNEASIAKAATKFEFTESNKENGKFLPKSKDKVVKFMCSLSKEQNESFQEILSELPKVQIFGELGDLGSEGKKAFEEIETKVAEKMKEDEAMTYADAMKEVIAENPELNKRYEKENK